MSDRRFYTIKQIMEQTGFSRAFLYIEAGRGKLTLRKCGGRTVVLAEDLDRWIATFEVVPAARVAA